MHKFFDLNTYVENRHIIGVVAIFICLATWALDLSNFVYECPYCRTQRTVIGILGALLLLPTPYNWVVRFIGSVFGAVGLHVAIAQNFMGWIKISQGKFSFYDPIYMDWFILSGFGIFIIAGLTWLLFLNRPDS